MRGSVNKFFHFRQNKWFLGNQGWALYGMHIGKDSLCFWVPAWGSDVLLPYACDCPSAWWRFSLIYSEVIVLRLDISPFHNYSACCRSLKCWEFSANTLCSSKNAWSILHFVKEREKKKSPIKCPGRANKKAFSNLKWSKVISSSRTIIIVWCQRNRAEVCGLLVNCCHRFRASRCLCAWMESEHSGLRRANRTASLLTVWQRD